MRTFQPRNKLHRHKQSIDDNEPGLEEPWHRYFGCTHALNSILMTASFVKLFLGKYGRRKI